MSTAQFEIAQDYLVSEITSGRMPEGHCIPHADTVAEATGVSSHAVRRAFRNLSDRGILKSVRRKRTTVLRRPALGRVLFMSSVDPHTNLLLQDEINRALIDAHLEIEFRPYLFHDGSGYEQLRILAGQEMHDTVLVTLAQERVPVAMRPKWEAFAAGFRARVGFQYEENRMLPDSHVVLPDPQEAARVVADHLLALGHRRIGVVAGARADDGTSSERHTAAITELLAQAGGECFPFQYSRDATQGPVAFVKEHRCTAWWAVSDHQAIVHIAAFQQAGLRVPDDLSVIGANDTPWARHTLLPLTSLSINPPAIAAAITTAVESVFEGGRCRALSGRQYVPPVLMPRASTVAICGK